MDCDRNPTNGGPVKNPIYPTVEMEVIDGPTFKIECFPAILYTKGIMQDNPKPIIK